MLKIFNNYQRISIKIYEEERIRQELLYMYKFAVLRFVYEISQTNSLQDYYQKYYPDLILFQKKNLTLKCDNFKVFIVDPNVVGCHKDELNINKFHLN